MRPLEGAGSAGAKTAEAAWALALFNRSVLKQEKYRQIATLLGDTTGLTCLDIGGDNGVISHLLRQRGGRWSSADLDETSVAAIRQVVGTGVHQIDGLRTPFPDRLFDAIVIIDFLEHIDTDAQFAEELARILKPGGLLIVNVPHLKPRSMLNRIRHALGLTDEKHGHVRPGYSLDGLLRTLGNRFDIAASRTYSKAFSETVDLALNGAFELLQRLKSRGSLSKKGTVVTRADVEAHRKEFLLLSLAYPVLRLVASLDRLLFMQPGYKLIIKTVRNGDPPGR